MQRTAKHTFSFQVKQLQKKIVFWNNTVPCSRMSEKVNFSNFVGFFLWNQMLESSTSQITLKLANFKNCFLAKVQILSNSGEVCNVFFLLLQPIFCLVRPYKKNKTTAFSIPENITLEPTLLQFLKIFELPEKYYVI